MRTIGSEGQLTSLWQSNSLSQMPNNDVLTIYEKAAVVAFNELSRLKIQRKALDAEIKDAEGRLSKSLAQGDLKLWQDPENKNTFRYDGVCYVFCPGRVTYDYSHCEDVIAAEDNLKEVKSMAAATGLVKQKQGKPFWSVR